MPHPESDPAVKPSLQGCGCLAVLSDTWWIFYTAQDVLQLGGAGATLSSAVISQTPSQSVVLLEQFDKISLRSRHGCSASTKAVRAWFSRSATVWAILSSRMLCSSWYFELWVFRLRSSFIGSITGSQTGPYTHVHTGTPIQWIALCCTGVFFGTNTGAGLDIVAMQLHPWKGQDLQPYCPELTYSDRNQLCRFYDAWFWPFRPKILLIERFTILCWAFLRHFGMWPSVFFYFSLYPSMVVAESNDGSGADNGNIRFLYCKLTHLDSQ